MTPRTVRYRSVPGASATSTLHMTFEPLAIDPRLPQEVWPPDQLCFDLATRLERVFSLVPRDELVAAIEPQLPSLPSDTDDVGGLTIGPLPYLGSLPQWSRLLAEAVIEVLSAWSGQSLELQLQLPITATMAMQELDASGDTVRRELELSLSEALLPSPELLRQLYAIPGLQAPPQAAVGELRGAVRQVVNHPSLPLGSKVEAAMPRITLLGTDSLVRPAIQGLGLTVTMTDPVPEEWERLVARVVALLAEWAGLDQPDAIELQWSAEGAAV